MSPEDESKRVVGVATQTIANWVFVLFMALIGYAWNQNLADQKQNQADLKLDRALNAEQAVDIARLQEWRSAQEKMNELFLKQLDDINRKLDRLLLMPTRATFQRGSQFDK